MKNSTNKKDINFILYAILSSMIKSVALFCLTWDMKAVLCSVSMLCTLPAHYLLSHHCSDRSNRVSVIYMAPKHKSSDASNFITV
jgi:hypothetical protein